MPTLLFVALALILLTVCIVLVRTLAVKAGKLQETVVPKPVTGESRAIAERLSGAIKFRTISFAEQERIDGAQFLGLHKYLKECYPNVAKTLSWEVISDYSLLLSWKGSGRDKPLALLSHMDVVPVTAGTEGDWVYPAFDGVIDGEYVWGRGAMDMKGHLITVLDAVEGLLADGFSPKSDIYLCFGHNEEIVSAPGSGASAIVKVLRDRGIRLDMVIDEGGVVIPGKQMLGIPGLLAVVGTAEKGYMDISLSCAQDGGHSSQPPQSTALGILAKAVVRLENSPSKPRLIGTVQGMFGIAGKYMGFTKRMIFTNLWLFKPLLLKTLTAKPLTNALVRTTFAATMASASPAANVLPQKAEIIANMRLLPGDDMEGALAEVANTTDDDRVQVRLVKGKNPSAESSTDTDGYRLIKSTLEELYPGVLVAPYLMIGGTDSCLYEPVCANIYRISPFLIGNEDLKATHGTNERISATNLLRGVEFFKMIIQRL